MNEDDRLTPIQTMSVFQSKDRVSREDLERAIEAALWHIDSSVYNPNALMAANTYSLTGGEACEAPLERAIEVLRGTGLRAKEPGDEAD